MNEEGLAEIWEVHRILGLCLEHYSMHKAILPEDNLAIESKEKTFRILTADAHLQMAVVLWCKVFGSKRNNPTYWENFNIDSQRFFELLAICGISKDGFSEHQRQMKAFRDKYISHTDKYADPVPYFSDAIKAVYALNNTMRESASELELEVIPWFSEWYPLIDEDYIEYIHTLFH